MPDASTSGADARQRQHNQGNQERKYTLEQKQAVLRIRRCKPTAFYEILEIQKSCTDSEVKKAYRKQSLLTHPDKNGHEHADEAFKMVARAFSVLGDKDKRDKFDRFGTDPDSRFGQQQQQQSPFSGFANRGGGGGGGQQEGMWGDDISPEEMFARFFGGGGGGGFNAGPFGGAFDAGPGFVFNFGGGPGVRVHQFGGPRPRARPRNPGQPEAETSIFGTLMGLLPILLLFIFPLLSSLFAGDATTSIPDIAYEQPKHPQVLRREMPDLHVPFFVNPKDVDLWTESKLKTLDKQAQLLYMQGLRGECQKELERKQRMRDEAQGWFFQDPDKMAMAQALHMPACRRMESLGLSTR
ncbi:hypothetical protein B0T22DRAFT_385273 [Podospora appendiculata]|uniref:J domain-containing protein n=1 Tax=Podospora appendiculata TaxID=314037 RepID=A0AAE1C8W4_9PEZI|nr:hypothetical protein B0T22DRAFT_385273 [Podospora appendiculata]